MFRLTLGMALFIFVYLLMIAHAMDSRIETRNAKIVSYCNSVRFNHLCATELGGTKNYKTLKLFTVYMKQGNKPKF